MWPLLRFIIRLRPKLSQIGRHMVNFDRKLLLDKRWCREFVRDSKITKKNSNVDFRSRYRFFTVITDVLRATESDLWCIIDSLTGGRQEKSFVAAATTVFFFFFFSCRGGGGGGSESHLIEKNGGDNVIVISCRHCKKRALDDVTFFFFFFGQVSHTNTTSIQSNSRDGSWCNNFIIIVNCYWDETSNGTFCCWWWWKERKRSEDVLFVVWLKHSALSGEHKARREEEGGREGNG